MGPIGHKGASGCAGPAGPQKPKPVVKGITIVNQPSNVFSAKNRKERKLIRRLEHNIKHDIWNDARV